MKKKILLLLYFAIVIICGRQSLSYFYNQYVLNEYNNGNYSINENLLLNLNIIEPYIVHYNNGNILFQNMLYSDAIVEYENALSYPAVPDDKVYSIRINIALSKIAQLPQDYDSWNYINESIATITEARDGLTEGNCANSDNSGNSSAGQELYNELTEELDRLSNLALDYESMTANRITVNLIYSDTADSSSYNASFELRQDNANGDVYKTLTQDGNTYLCEDLLEEGTYFLIEKDVPDGYTGISPVQLTVDSNRKITINNVVDNVDARIVRTGYEAVLDITNSLIPDPVNHSFQIDLSFPNASDEENLVAEFELRETSQLSDAIGTFSQEGTQYNFTATLSSGSYCIVETNCPDEYYSSQPFYFSIGLDGQLVVDDYNNNLVQYEIINDGRDLHITLIKIDTSSTIDPSDINSQIDPSTITISPMPIDESDSSYYGNETVIVNSTVIDGEMRLREQLRDGSYSARVSRQMEIYENADTDSLHVNNGCW